MTNGGPAFAPTRIADGQRELNISFTSTVLCPSAKGPRLGRRSKPRSRQRDMAAPKFDDDLYFEIARNHLELVPKALVAWLEKSERRLDRVAQRRGASNTLKLLEHLGRRFSRHLQPSSISTIRHEPVPAFPPTSWRLVQETRPLIQLGFVDPSNG